MNFIKLLFLVGTAYAIPMIENTDNITRIIGGNGVGPHYAPFVQIQRSVVDQNVFSFHCGGTLLSPRTVLTSAHCVEDTKNYKYRVKWKSPTLGGSVFELGLAQLPNLHPKYRKSRYPHDLAVLVLRGRANTGTNLQPVTLSKTYPTNRVAIYGHGITTSYDPDNTPTGGSSYVQRLRSANVTILSETACDELIKSFDLSYTVPKGSVICAVDPDVGACIKDKGGPAMKIGAERIQFGVISDFAVGCELYDGEYYSYFTSVSYKENYEWLRVFEHYV